MTEINIKGDLRSLFGQARDQGDRPTCLSFAMSDAHAAARGEPWEPLSCEYLFYYAKSRDQTPPVEGTTVASILSALAVEGQPVETAWPYLMTLPTDLTEWVVPSDIDVIHRRLATSELLDFGQICKSVDSGIPVLAVITISDSFYQPDIEGVVDGAEAVEPTLKHAIVVVATGMRGAKRFVMVRNSWGTEWGLSGFAWLSEAYLKPRVVTSILL